MNTRSKDFNLLFALAAARRRPDSRRDGGATFSTFAAP
jgi:hypothetical protein